MQPELTEEYLSSQGLSKTFPQRFWERVKKTETCWMWTRKPESSGYGSIGMGLKRGKNIRSHRASWILNRGPIPKGMFVLHNCPGGDNRLCVNPDHLWLGTHIENIADAKQKGVQVGEPHAYKLDIEKVLKIRELVADGASQTKVAKLFSVTQSHVSRLVRGQTWFR